MNLGELMNTIECGASNILGTGLKGCKVFFKKTASIWVLPAGTELDSDQEFGETYINTLKSEGKLIVLKGVRTFTDNSGDDNIEELEDGTKQVTRLGLYEFMAKFVNGLYFHAALSSLSSFGNYDVIFVDRDGNMLGTKSASGKLKGFSVGMLQNSRLEWGTDSTGQKEGIYMQLTERSELDDDFVFIQRSQLSFNPNKVEGVNEVLLSYPDGISAGTSLTVKAVLRSDGSPFVGLPAANWAVTIAGASEAPTGDDSVEGGTYVLTVSSMSASDTVVTQTIDGNNDVVTLDGYQYKGSPVSGVVV
jgi:hypothetical protein